MKTITCYSTMPWFNPFWEFSVLEPMLELNDELRENYWETSNAYVFVYSLPEFRKKDVSVELRDDVIYIKGALKKESAWWKKKQYEAFEHRFTKTIQLSNDMCADKIRAKFRHGDLRIEIGKKRSLANVKEIPVFGADGGGELSGHAESKTHGVWHSLKQKMQHLFKQKQGV